MKNPRVIILSGYGLNCEEETAQAFELAGGHADIVHINDLVAQKNKLMKYQILAIPGGFSYGDDTGSGRAYANKLKNHLRHQLWEFAEKDKLIIGICNGFQILTSFGLLPGALIFNDFPRYTVRWADLRMSKILFAKPGQRESLTPNPWLTNIKTLSLPIAHGEGKFYAPTQTLAIIKKQRQIAAKYYAGEISKSLNLKPNPNGSLMNIAMITSQNGRILGTMPHPERAVFFTQHPLWTLKKEKLTRTGKPIPKFGPSLQLFKNAVKYFT